MRNSMRTYFRLLAENRQKGFLANALCPVAAGASLLYGFGSGILQNLYRAGILPRRKIALPVISVGNITWGGAGKTPFVEYLARKIVESHKVPMILSRGYDMDEVEQMKHHLPQAIIAVGADRFRAAEEALKTRKADIVLLDDGMQHWPLERDLDVAVINSLNPFGNGHLIPRGILREPVQALNRASLIILTHINLIAPAELTQLKEKLARIAPHASICEAYLEPLFFYRASKRKRVSLDRLQNQRVATFSGVGTPRSFQLLLSRCSIRPTRNFEFSDHHHFTDIELAEVKRVSESASVEEIITTEKDFYRSPDKITQILNPLVLATRLRIASGEEHVTDKIQKLLGVSLA